MDCDCRELSKGRKSRSRFAILGHIVREGDVCVQDDNDAGHLFI